MLPDPIEGQPLIGQAAAEAELAAAIASTRMHHGWILTGPSGIGKATLAFRASRFLLCNGAQAVPGRLDCDPNLPACHKVSAHSHPGLLVVQPPAPEPGRKAGLIPVERVRKIGQFLGTTSGEGDWRIVVIDPADGLNRAGQNAILKLLEEPPERALFFIVAHQLGRLLPTIRSRCRVLELAPLDQAALTEILDNAGVNAAPAQRDLAIRFAHGDVERAAMIAGGEFGDGLAQLADLIDALPAVDAAVATAFADKAGGRGAELLFDITIDALCDWLHHHVRGTVSRQVPATLAPYADLWEKINARAGRTRGYNLDRSHCILASLFDIEDAFKPAGPSA